MIETIIIDNDHVNNLSTEYGYDTINRVTSKKLHTPDSPQSIFATEYKYDINSQITQIVNSAGSRKYYQRFEYGKDNNLLNYTFGGNILNKKIYPLTSGKITGIPTETITYSYENSNWCDQLTAYNGQQITYDEIGNPTNYLGYNLSWFGRQLNSLSGNGLDVSYAYDQSGTRIGKTVNGVKYEYQYEGGKLFYEKRDKAEFYYLYDGLGHLTSIIHYDGNGNRAQYYVLCNSRGDVVDIYNQDGTIAAHYIYDSWGNTISIKDRLMGGREITDPNNIGILNQIRYRGYYLDTETGYYYLMSRYYNPEIGRFLNADIFCSTGDSAFATNMYIYCLNNPVNSMDSNGLKTATETVGAIITEMFVCWDVQWVAIITQQDFSFNGFENYKRNKAEIYKNGFDSGLVNFWSGATNVATTITEWLCGVAGYVESIFPNSVRAALKTLPYAIDAINDYSGRYLSSMGAFIMVLSDIVINGMIDIFGTFVSIMINEFVGNTFSWIAGHLYGENQRNQFELLAYNWYLY